MNDLYHCKTCGFVDEDQVQPVLTSSGIENRCVMCGKEVSDGDEKLRELGNILLKVFHPYTKATFK